MWPVWWAIITDFFQLIWDWIVYILELDWSDDPNLADKKDDLRDYS